VAAREGYGGAARRGERYDTAFFSRPPDSKIVLRVPGRYVLDNLAVRHIRTEEVQDVAAFRNALDEIPADKRVGSVPFSGVKPAEGSEEVPFQFGSQPTP
jgi:hypothetical protein